MVTPEVTPFAQTGGLGEVLAALPAALAKLGLEVDVLMPMYRGISPDSHDLKKLGLRIAVDINAKMVPGEFWVLNRKGGPRLLFLQCDDYYDRDQLYGTQDGDYEDNSERFVFLSRAAIEMALALGINYDVFHSHDWQAALTPVYLRTFYAGEPLLRDSASVTTIHNLGYQGIFWHWDMPLVGVGWEYFTPKYMEFHGKVNFLKSGIVFSDKVNTVSRGYSEEILTPDYGFGLEGVLQEKGNALEGILNGVDYETWNPETDPHIAANFSLKDLSGKAACKADLQKRAGLKVKPDVPLIAMVSRLSSQKGIDLLEGAIPSLVKHDVQFVLLGTGEYRYQKSFSEFGDLYPDKIKPFLSYDYELAHKIFAGADMALIPSRYEPCGLNQLYAMKYGTVPIVRDIGGLMDTVEQFVAKKKTGTGFKFVDAESKVLEATVLKALSAYRSDKDSWKQLMSRGMSQNFSWQRSAKEYVRLYQEAIDNRIELLRSRR
jgi:starch synthase